MAAARRQLRFSGSEVKKDGDFKGERVRHAATRASGAIEMFVDIYLIRNFPPLSVGSLAKTAIRTSEYCLSAT